MEVDGVVPEPWNPSTRTFLFRPAPITLPRFAHLTSSGTERHVSVSEPHAVLRHLHAAARNATHDTLFCPLRSMMRVDPQKEKLRGTFVLKLCICVAAADVFFS